MADPCSGRIALGFGLLIAAFVAAAPAQESINCDAVKADIAFKRQLLSQHVAALKKLDDQDELAIMALSSDKIRQLIEEIQKIRASAQNCPQLGPGRRKPGLDEVRFEQGEYATQSCEKLRNSMFQLLQKVLALKRREGSFFSALSPAEAIDLQDAERALNEVKEALKRRCPSEEPHSPFRKKLR